MLRDPRLAAFVEAVLADGAEQVIGRLLRRFHRNVRIHDDRVRVLIAGIPRELVEGLRQEVAVLKVRGLETESTFPGMREAVFL